MLLQRSCQLLCACNTALRFSGCSNQGAYKSTQTGVRRANSITALLALTAERHRLGNCHSHILICCQRMSIMWGGDAAFQVHQPSLKTHALDLSLPFDTEPPLGVELTGRMTSSNRMHSREVYGGMYTVQHIACRRKARATHQRLPGRCPSSPAWRWCC